MVIKKAVPLTEKRVRKYDKSFNSKKLLIRFIIMSIIDSQQMLEIITSISLFA